MPITCDRKDGKLLSVRYTLMYKRFYFEIGLALREPWYVVRKGKYVNNRIYNLVNVCFTQIPSQNTIVFLNIFGLTLLLLNLKIGFTTCTRRNN